MGSSLPAHDYEAHLDSLSDSIRKTKQRLRDVEGIISHWQQTGNKQAISKLIRKLAAEERGLLHQFISYLRDYKHDDAQELAHDLRNGLTGLTVYLGMIEKDQEGMRQDLIKSGMDKSVHYLEGLIKGTVTGSQDSQYELLDLSYLIRRAIKICGARAVQPELFLARTIIRGNRVSLIRVFVNLLENAYDALPRQNGVIVIRALVKNQHCVVIVSDNGHGVQAENISKIFQKHFTTKPQGRGIGLEITRKIIEQHGGQIKVYSIAQEGSDFIVSFPKA